jgi:DHA2 family methylenomycin A resistance protein-like MFS transporter
MRVSTVKYEAFGAGAPHAGSRLATSLTLAAMSLGYGVVQLDVTIVNTALDAMGRTLGGGVAELQWVVSAYSIAFAAFILTAGALGDRIGAKRVFMAGFAIFTAASLACALSPNATVLIAARLSRGWRRQSWYRILWRCSAMPIRTTSSAAAPLRSGPPVRASL